MSDVGLIVAAGRNYAIFSEVMDYKMYRETRILEGETANDATMRLYRDMDALAVKIKVEAEAMRGVHIKNVPCAESTQPTVIDKKFEQAEIDFDNATTLQELELAKAKYDVLPGKIQRHYVHRLKELSA